MFDNVLARVSKLYGVSVSDIIRHRRPKYIIRPRRLAMAAASLCTKASLPVLARRFNRLDHTTILYAVGKVKADPLMLAEAQAIASACGWSEHN